MLGRLWTGPERRRHPRHTAALEIEIEVEVYGFEDARPFFASGTTLDVSRSGVLTRLDTPLRSGCVCNVFFLDTRVRTRAHHVAGRIRRCDERNGDFVVAVEFDEPLLTPALETLIGAAMEA